MKPIVKVLAAASSLAILATTPALANDRGISKQEMVHKFMRIFDRLDSDGNGKVSRRFLRRIEKRGRNHRNGPNIRVVFGDENFRIAFGTGGGRHRGGSSYLGPINTRTFHIYDLNNDGVIYRRELRRAVRIEFDRADRNGDGYLSQRELNRSNWYRTSLARSHDRYYPDYRRDRRRAPQGHNQRHRDTRRDAHHDTRRSTHRDTRRDAHRDTRRGTHRDGGHDTGRHRDGDRTADRQRDGHRDQDAHRSRDGRKDGHRSGKRKRDKRTRSGDDHTRDRDGKRHREN